MGIEEGKFSELLGKIVDEGYILQLKPAYSGVQITIIKEGKGHSSVIPNSMLKRTGNRIGIYVLTRILNSFVVDINEDNRNKPS